MDGQVQIQSIAADEAADSAGCVIEATDVEELQGSVAPWDLEMRQVSSGAMNARIRPALVGDVLVTREHWSQQVLAVGSTPAGYLALAGPGSKRTFKWCGHEIDSRHVLCGLDSAEVDFATPRSADHWVVLVPHDLLAGHLGMESVEEVLRGRRVLRCEPGLSNRLLTLADRAVDLARGGTGRGRDRHLATVLAADLVEAAAQLVTGEDGNRGRPSPRRYYRVCRLAASCAEDLHAPIAVQELAAAIGVRRRTLERAFAATLGISPYRFLHLHRMNRLHKSLRAAHAEATTVTACMLDWGFTELGRTAVEYKSLFGESPSATLHDDASRPHWRLADALADGAGR